MDQRTKDVESEWLDERSDYAKGQPELVNHAITMLTSGTPAEGVRAVLEQQFNCGKRKAREIVIAARSCLIRAREEDMPELRRRYRDMTVLTWVESMKYKEFGPATSCLRILTAMDGVNEPSKVEVSSSSGVIVLDGSNRAKSLEEWVESSENDDPPQLPAGEPLQ